MSASLERLMEMILVLGCPGALRTWWSSTAFSAPCFRLAFELKRFQPRFDTIFDVGANVGQFALAAAAHFPRARIASFEPLPEAYRELCRNSAGQPRIRPFNFALGDADGRLSFHHNHYSRLSSALAIHSGNRHPRYRERRTRPIEVAVRRLDDLVERLQPASPVLLKIDVQGMERAVLQGAVRSLEQVDFLLFEAAFEPLYQGQPLFDELHRFVQELGFRLLAPLRLNRSREGTIIEMDVLYHRVSRPRTD